MIHPATTHLTLMAKNLIEVIDLLRTKHAKEYGATDTEPGAYLASFIRDVVEGKYVTIPVASDWCLFSNVRGWAQVGDTLSSLLAAVKGFIDQMSDQERREFGEWFHQKHTDGWRVDWRMQ